MSEILDSFLNGLAGSSGKSISDGMSDVSKGFKKIKEAFVSDTQSQETGDSLNDEILKYFSNNIADIEIETLTSQSEYKDILKWAARNKCGDRLYLVKHNQAKNGASLLFAFFGQGENLFLDKMHPQHCFVAEILPPSINDLFQGKSIYIQPFK